MQYSQCKQKWDPSPLPRVAQPWVHTVPQTAHTVTKHRGVGEILLLWPLKAEERVVGYPKHPNNTPHKDQAEA